MEAQSSKGFLTVWNGPKIVLQTLGKPANRLKRLDRELKGLGTFAHFRSEAAHAQAEAQSSKSFLAVWNGLKIVLQTLGKPANRLKKLDRELKWLGTFAHLTSEVAHAQAEAQSSKSFLAVWNGLKIVLQTLGKPASRLKRLDREPKGLGTFSHLRSEAAHAQAKAQSSNSFLAVWNGLKIVLQTLGKPANRLKRLDREPKGLGTFSHLRSEAAHAQAEAQSSNSFLAVWNGPKIVLQTVGKVVSRLQVLGGERKVRRTFAHFRMSRFIIKFWGDLADQRGSVVV